MSKLTRRTVVLVKENTGSYGTDPTPAASDGVLCNMTPSIAPDGDVIERNPVRDTMSPQGHVIGAKYNTLTLECELKGGGLDGSNAVQAPEYDALLKCCGLQRLDASILTLGGSDDASAFTLGETVTGGTSGASGKLVQIIGTTGGKLVVTEISGGPFQDAEDLTGGTSSATGTVSGSPEAAFAYKPQSDPDSVADAGIYFHADGIRHKALGCIGDASLGINVGQIPTITFNLSSLYATPTDVALPSPDTLDLTPPVAHNIGLTVGSYSPVAVNALTLGLNNTVSRRDDVNASEGISSYAITDRRPQGSLDPEVDTLANFDPFTAWENASSAAVSAAVGNVSGNRVGLYVPKALYQRVQYQDRNGYRTYQLPFLARIDDTTGAGDDELYLVYT
jgi:hypothetical protein